MGLSLIASFILSVMNSTRTKLKRMVPGSEVAEDL